MSFKSLLGLTKKVLIVEDDAQLRASLATSFEQSGFKVFQAGDAKEVGMIVASEQIDALVLDLILPLQDGISLLEELRNEAHTMPVIILSNLLGSENLRADAERLDAVFYNKSATSLEQIVQAVQEQVSK